MEQFPITQFSFDVLNKILSFFWFNDLCTITCVSTCFKDVSAESSAWNTSLKTLLQLTSHIHHSRHDPIHLDPVMMESKIVHLLARRIPPWPSDIDRVALNRPEGPDNIEVIPTPERRTCVVYSGRVLGGDRAVIANRFFPCHPPKSSLPTGFPDSQYIRNPSSSNGGTHLTHIEHRLQLPHHRLIAPFTKVTVLGGVHRVTLSCIAYFEATIHEQRPGSVQESIQATQPQYTPSPPCVAIGVACALFPLRMRMPGWDVNSFGYHGDDGNFFHGRARSGTPSGPTFGTGDTVGCGLMYPPLTGNCSGSIFFTKNGEVVFSRPLPAEGILNVPYFPVVGIDAFNPIDVNFGGREFVFNVHSFESSEMADRLNGATWSLYTELALHQETFAEPKMHPSYRDPSTKFSDIDVYSAWFDVSNDNVHTRVTSSNKQTSTLEESDGSSSEDSYDQLSINDDFSTGHSLFLSERMIETTSFCIRHIQGRSTDNFNFLSGSADELYEDDEDDDDDDDDDEDGTGEVLVADEQEEEALGGERAVHREGDDLEGENWSLAAADSHVGEEESHTVISPYNEELPNSIVESPPDSQSPPFIIASTHSFTVSTFTQPRDLNMEARGMVLMGSPVGGGPSNGSTALVGSREGEEKADEDDGRSVTTSLHAEVASVDGGDLVSAYAGYGYNGASSETEGGEDTDTGPINMCWRARQWNLEPSSPYPIHMHMHHMHRSRFRGRGRGFRGKSPLDISDASLGDGDGYDAASELGRGYVTDDIPTDVGDECVDDEVTESCTDKSHGIFTDRNVAQPD